MRIAFLATPQFAVPALEAVAREHEVVLVVAQPDKPAGRGMKLHAPEVAVRARELGLAVAQPPKIRDAAALEQVAAARPDIGVVIAYGKILPPALLAIPRFGFINIHASILPKYRGAAPIQRAIEQGETTTGVTIMRVDEELDHGAMLSIATTPIGPNEHTPSLAARLAGIGAEALLPVLAAIENGTAMETPQDHAAATYAHKIDKQEGLVNWSQPAKTIYDKFRAFDPWPGLFTESMKLIDIECADGEGAAGNVIGIGDAGVTVAAGNGAIRIRTVQRPGKAKHAVADLARAERWRVGAPLP